MRITERIIIVPGTRLPGRIAGTIDLSGAEPPGPPPVIITRHEVSGVVLLAHTRDFTDESAPILVDPRPIWPGPDGTAAADARCGSCTAAGPFIVPGEEQTLIVLQHRPGCRELAALAELAGVTP
jgi:hypothetical protein